MSSEEQATPLSSMTPAADTNDLIYEVEDVPPWYLSLFFGFQHYLTMASVTISIPLVVASFLCLKEDDPARGALVSTVLIHSGIVTLVQTTFGIRLPVIQGTDFASMIPVITILTTVHEPCAALPLANMTEEARQEEWQSRMRDIQGAISAASVFQILLGLTGLMGVLLRWITPLAIAPTVTLVGLSLFDVAGDKAASHWGISVMTIVLMVVFSQYFSHIDVPLLVLTKGQRGLSLTKTSARVFRCFPVLIAVLVSWGVCGILTVCDVLPPGSPARTDATGDLMERTPWFFAPYPGQWGWPRVTVVGLVGMLAAAATSIMESVGDYYACAKISGASPPPTSAINRAVAVEGLGALLAGVLGTGCGTTSCSQNIGIISVTKVASRRVVQFAGLILIVSGFFGKFGAAFVTIPEPVIAGILVTMFSMITSVGLMPLQHIHFTTRNLFVLGFSIFIGLLLPKWLKQNPDSIGTGSDTGDQILRVLLQTPMVVGGVLGCFLDNTLPGSDEERGLNGRNQVSQESSAPRVVATSRCYDLPWITPFMQRTSWMRFLPFSPTYQDNRRGTYTW